MKNLIISLFFIPTLAAGIISNNSLEWPELVRAVDQFRCLHFGDQYYTVKVDINTETLTYEKWIGTCLEEHPTKIFGTLEKSTDSILIKSLVKKCYDYADGYYCREFESISDGSFQIEDSNTLIEISSSGYVRRYEIIPSIAS